MFLCLFLWVMFKHFCRLSAGLMARSSLIGPLVQHSNLKWMYFVTSPYFSERVLLQPVHMLHTFSKLLRNFTFQHLFPVFFHHLLNTCIYYIMESFLPTEQISVLVPIQSMNSDWFRALFWEFLYCIHIMFSRKDYLDWLVLCDHKHWMELNGDVWIHFFIHDDYKLFFWIHLK